MARVRFFPLLLTAATLFAVLGVAQRARVIHLGYRVERLEGERALLAENNRRLLCEISALSHPARIAGEIRRVDVSLLDPVALTRASAGARSHRLGDPGEHRGRSW